MKNIRFITFSQRMLTLLLLIILMILTRISFGQTIINFDTNGNWTAGSGAITSYETNHTHTSNNWTFTGGPALRQTATAQDGVAGANGTYAWRLEDASCTWTGTYNAAATISAFGFDHRRWDSSPAANWTVSYSTNSGSSWTSAGTLTYSNSNWATFSYTLPTAATVASGAFRIRIVRSSGERIMIDNFSFTTVTCSAPTTQASNVSIASITTSSASISWTSGNGTKRAVFIKSGVTTGTPAPADNTTYTASTTFGSGTQIGSSGWYCIYNNTGTGVAVSGLNPSTNYRVMVVEYNCAAGSEKYYTTAGTDNPDNFTTSAAAACTTPDALAFEVQPSSVVQNATMTAVKVKAICSSGGGTATSYTGAITLTLNSPGCGYTSQTVNAVAGVATFSNVVILRSAQSNINFTASATSLTSITSSNFNVTLPSGSSTVTSITQNNFDATTTWGYSIGTPSTVGSGGSSGTDVTGTKANGGSNVLCKSYSADNGSNERGTMTTVTFNNVAGLSTYDQVDFEFKVCSFGSGTGAGNDSGEDFILQVSTNGGSSWSTILTEIGSSNRLLTLSATPVTQLSLSTNSTYSGSDTKSAFKLSLAGISQFSFRFTAQNNRTGENWGIDDVKLTGTILPTGVPFNLPAATATSATTVCNTADGIQLGAGVTSFQAPLAFSWTPTPTLDDPASQNPVAYLSTASQLYSVQVTDGHNCKVTATITVTNPGFGGTAGLWTGEQSTDWFDCRNWSDNRVPDASTAVTINQTASDECVIDEFDAVCASLTLTSTNGTENNLTLTTTGTLTITNALSITNSGSGDIQLVMEDNAQLTCGSLTIDGVSNGDAKLKHEVATTLVTVNGNLTIQPGGELDLSDGTNGTAGGIVHVKGNFVNNATETDFKQDESTIVFNGTGNQDISLAGTNTEIFYNLTSNKASGTLTLSDNIQVSNQLTMSAGNINTQTSTLELGTSTSVKGTLSYTSGYVLGKMKRWMNGTNSGNASGLFPMGFDQGGIKNRNVSVEYSAAPTAGGHLTVQFMGTNMGTSGLPILAASSGSGFDVTSTENLGYWKIDPETGKLANGTYKITCTGEGFGTITDISKLTLLKRVVSSGPNWFCPGTHIAATGTTSVPVLARSGVSGWSNFGFGGGTVNPLPVELISFTASCGDQTLLSWSTASESNSDYFSLEKTADGIQWQEIAKIQSAGNTSQITEYSIEDVIRTGQTAYYRLSQFDFDGTRKTYEPISADCETQIDINLYPNPNNGNFALTVNASDLKGTIGMYITSAEGRMVHQQEMNAVAGSTLFEFTNERLSSGVYFVAVRNEGAILKTIRMVVE